MVYNQQIEEGYLEIKNTKMTYKEKRHLMMVINKYMYDNNMSSTQWLLNGNVIEFYKFDEEVKYAEVKLNDIINNR